MLISIGLSLDDPLMSTAGPVRMLAVVGAENSRSDLSAMTSISGVKLWVGWSSDSGGLASWDVDDIDWFLLNLAFSWSKSLDYQQSYMGDQTCSYITLHMIKIDKKTRVKLHEWEGWMVLNPWVDAVMLIILYCFHLPQQRRQKCLLTLLNATTKNRLLNLSLAMVSNLLNIT